jgi:hypothetical protein
MYLREILAAASGQDSHLQDAPYNDFSERAYREVLSVLGRRGEAYLGLGKARPLQLVPDEGRTRTQLIFEDDMRGQLEEAEAERRAEGEDWPDENPFAKPLPDWTDHWEPYNPFMEPWPWPAEPAPQESQPFGSAPGQRRNGYGGFQ